MLSFCDRVVGFDDASTDNSLEIAQSFYNVTMIGEANWNPNQTYVQSIQRTRLFNYARDLTKDDYYVYMDADEVIDLTTIDWELLDESFGNGRLRLFDAYLTADDCKEYKKGSLFNLRKNFGPEYRDILFFFNRNAIWSPNIPTLRQPYPDTIPNIIGFVQHYGKALSIEHWEKTCDYYIKYLPVYKEKWLKRKGKAIHILSDFDNKLYTWNELINNKSLQIAIN